MLRFMSLSSGSCGNCYYIGDEEKALLIDAGVGPMKLKSVFKDNSLDINTVAGILVTHDHWDHIRSLAPLCKRFHKPVYTTEILLGALSAHPCTSATVASYGKELPSGVESDICGFKVRWFEIPHDATQTVGYSIDIDGHNFVIMTDIGAMTETALSFASKADTLVIESNFDVDMLLAGNYTYDLKMRIMQGNGHLSNDACADALKQIWHPDLHNIFLCHLSENNNTPAKAHEASSAALASLGIEEGSVSLRCLPRTYPSSLFNLF